jgi:hypothetical protein
LLCPDLGLPLRTPKSKSLKVKLMPDPTITCTKCGAEIPLGEAVSHRLREGLEEEFKAERTKLNAALAEREAKLDARSKSVADEVARAMESERVKLAAAGQQQAEEKLGAVVRDLRNQISEQQQKLQTAQCAELELRKKQRELEEAKQNAELAMARKLDEERAAIAENARRQAAEAERLKLADKDNKIRDLQQQISALQQRAEQGSVQAQGETLEMELEHSLKAAFPFDDIAEVKKGQRGADVRQIARTSNGMVCGQIIWEAKRAKNWTPDWVEKLKGDQRDAKADIAVIVTTCPPDGLRGIGQRDGVWVCEAVFAVALGQALRQGLVSTATQRVQQSNRTEKMAVLYDHLCSVEFRHQIEGIVEAFIALKDQIDAEKRAFAKQWKEREAQLEKAITNVAAVYGGIQGIAGREALPEISRLQLPGLFSEGQTASVSQILSP